MLLLDQKKNKSYNDDAKETEDEVEILAPVDDIPAFDDHQDEHIEEKRVNTFLF